MLTEHLTAALKFFLMPDVVYYCLAGGGVQDTLLMFKPSLLQ